MQAKLTSNSGAGMFSKGDVKHGIFLVECKSRLNKMPKIPRPGIFSKIDHEARLLHLVPALSLALITGTHKHNLVLTRLVFLVPANTPYLKDKLEVIFSAPLSPRTPAHWAMISDHQMSKLLEKMNDSRTQTNS